MANQRFRAATVYVSGTKIAEIAQSTYEHMSGVVKDQNETLATELSARHRPVGGWG